MYILRGAAPVGKHDRDYCSSLGFFWGTMSRAKCDAILRETPRGSFLLRLDPSTGGATFCVHEPVCRIKHINVRVGSGDYEATTTNGTVKRSSLMELLEALADVYNASEPVETTKRSRRVWKRLPSNVLRVAKRWEARLPSSTQ